MLSAASGQKSSAIRIRVRVRYTENPGVMTVYANPEGFGVFLRCWMPMLAWKLQSFNVSEQGSSITVGFVAELRAFL
jgi:hypothetical protein